jgi:hypothetical protein
VNGINGKTKKFVGNATIENVPILYNINGITKT